MQYDVHVFRKRLLLRLLPSREIRTDSTTGAALIGGMRARWIAIALIIACLIVLGASSLPMFRYTSNKGLTANPTEVLVLHEAAFGRITLAVVGIAVALGALRRRERSVNRLASLIAIFLLYIFPVFVRPFGGHFEPWIALRGVVRGDSLGRGEFWNYFFAALMLAGLLILLAQELGSHRSPSSGRVL